MFQVFKFQLSWSHLKYMYILSWLSCISEENRKRAVNALLIFTFFQEVLEMAHIFTDTPSHLMVIVICVMTCYPFSIAFHTSSLLPHPALLTCLSRVSYPPILPPPCALGRELCTQRFVYSGVETQLRYRRYRRNPISIFPLVYGTWRITFRKCPLGYWGEEPLFFAGAEHWVICAWFCSVQWENWFVFDVFIWKLRHVL